MDNLYTACTAYYYCAAIVLQYNRDLCIASTVPEDLDTHMDSIDTCGLRGFPEMDERVPIDGRQICHLLE
jgi:hypothetical protein